MPSPDIKAEWYQGTAVLISWISTLTVLPGEIECQTSAQIANNLHSCRRFQTQASLVNMTA